MIPFPQKVELHSGLLPLKDRTQIAVGDPALLPLARQLAHEIAVLARTRVKVAEGKGRVGDIVLSIDPALAADKYVADVGKKAQVRGGSHQALAWGTVTLLQSLLGDPKDPAQLPHLHVEDRPALGYRGLMVDLARQWHPIESLRMLVALCRWYKINYLHLHLTDDQSFTFPSGAYPKLPTPERHYTLEQLRELEAYAQTCGVTLLPELDIPGHSRALLTALPNKVGCGGKQGGCDLCPGRESTYSVMETLVGEMCEIFRTTPYFHIGADETERKAWKNCPHCRKRMAAEGLENEEELYRYFIIRLNEIVRKHGKQTLVWEGFGPGGKLKVPTDVAVMVFESDYHLAPDLLAAGYPVINTTWQPLSVVGPGLCWPPASISRWNPYRWETPWKRSPAYREPIQIGPTPAMWGAQLCSWGQRDSEELASLRERLAAMSERTWAPERTEAADFFARLENTDLK
ncbi:MAG: family 20 glycosylhydrolase, partial [Planctomycetes bacterium]|nr:family 20 glycosylhydrolase [Planctomycetota bacterium]